MSAFTPIAVESAHASPKKIFLFNDFTDFPLLPIQIESNQSLSRKAQACKGGKLKNNLSNLSSRYYGVRSPSVKGGSWVDKRAWLPRLVIWPICRSSLDCPADWS
jgi:hypothetical protein